ncbi:MAG TPA: type II secretion system protein [Phycisphaerales bacterium]|nr:type II secretion system protein [Phycisphaerales bacterium]
MRTTIRRAFTLIELLVVLGIIALLGSIILLAMGRVRKTGDVTAERAMVVALKNGVEQFKQEFGFLPPLVIDDPAGGPGGAPVDINGTIFVWPTTDLYLPTTTLNGSTGPTDRRCYSQYSLPYYLAGSCDELYDGVDGLGFTAPSSSHDGTFSKRGRRHEPIVDPTLQKTRSGQNRLSPRVPITGNTPANQRSRAAHTILDRWSDGTAINSRPIRYYRWLPDFWPQSNTAQSGQVHYWNIPFVVGGDPTNLNPPANIELKSAEWAIVSAGPDRLFGDEGGVYNPEAVKDNIVEVGR